MQTQCDSCHTSVASVFCYSKEMALCSSCNRCTHDGGGHHFPFHYPVPKSFPVCDVCQETKAFIFCVEHRTITCRVCDITLHSQDEFKKKHGRFLLTGAKLEFNDKIAEQLENNQSGGSTSSSINSECFPHNIDVSCDDPYGLCQKMGEGSGSTFADADLGCFLKSLSPK